jgi:hypothetical protein
VKSRHLVAIALLGLVVSGCAPDTESKEPVAKPEPSPSIAADNDGAVAVSTVDYYLRQFARGNGVVACSLLNASLRERIVADADTPMARTCPGAVKALVESGAVQPLAKGYTVVETTSTTATLLIKQADGTDVQAVVETSEGRSVLTSLEPAVTADTE